MHIENPEALKGWLTDKLAPLCDADPAALARYVLALLKKVKPEKELQTCMQEQLDVFLGQETESFLVQLMETIRTTEYLQYVPLPSTTPLDSDSVVGELAPASFSQPLVGNSSQQQQHTKEAENRPMSEDDALRVDATTSSPSLGASAGSTQHSSGSHSPIKPPVVASLESAVVSVNSGRRQRVSARSRSRSRSRSNERMSRAVRSSRDSRDRLNRHPAHRNKSPPGRRFDHRRGMKGGPGGGPGDRYGRRNLSRSRSRSPSYRGRMGSRSPSPMHGGVSSQPIIDGGDVRIPSQIVVGGKSTGKKCRDFEEKGYCMRGETCPWDHGVDPVVLEDINNPTLMTIQQQQQHHLREYNPDAPDIWPRGGGGGGFGPRGPIGGGGGVNAQNGGEFGQQRLPFRLSSGQVVGGMMNPSGLSQLNRELIPVPVMMDESQGGGGVGGHPGMGGHEGMGPKRRYEDQNQPEAPGMEQPPKRRPLAGRLGGRLGPGGPQQPGNGGAHGQQNCSLELRKVPRGLNSIAHLNNHFSKFGKIINIQVNYEYDPEAAIVTFSSHAEANVAYRSTEAVLNNRFIKVFWHNGTGNNNNIKKIFLFNNNNNNNTSNNNQMGGENAGKDAEGGPGAAGGQGGGPGGMRKGNQYHLNNVLNKQQQQVAAEGGSDQVGGTSTTEASGGVPATPTTGAGAAPAAVVVPSPTQLRLKMNRGGQAMRRKHDEQLKLAHGLVQKKHELLQEYLKQMRSCLELIEKVDALDPQRAKLLTTLTNLQDSIDKLRKEIAAEQTQLKAVQQQQAHHPVVARMTKEQQQKELLDLELELIAQQQEGNDTTQIQRRIHDLQQALSGGGGAQFQKGGQGNAAGGVGGHVQRARAGLPPGSTSVDRRPTTIFVAGFSVEDSDGLLGHFKHFGEITKHVLDQNIPSLIVSFAVRGHAEQAMQRGRVFKEKNLQMNWYIPNFVKQRQPEEEGDKEMPQVKSESLEEPEENAAADKSPSTAAAEIKAEPADATAVKVEPSSLEDEAAGAGDLDSELRLDDEEEEDLESENRSWRR